MSFGIADPVLRASMLAPSVERRKSPTSETVPKRRDLAPTSDSSLPFPQSARECSAAGAAVQVSTSSARKLEPSPVPPNQGLRLNDGQRLFPLKPARPKYQRDPRRIRQSPGLHFTLLTESQLLAEKQVLGDQRTPGTCGYSQESEQVNR